MRPAVLVRAWLAAVACPGLALATATIGVFPSGDEVPENLLRLSIALPAPASTTILSRLALRHCGGGAIDSPFLPQELWSPDGRRLTVLLHPGRVKTGLIAQERLGRAIEAGDCVVLTDLGHPLKRWRVSDSNRVPPDPMQWRFEAPSAKTKAALIVALGRPIDGADTNLIAIQDRGGDRLKGVATLHRGETIWSFRPKQPWHSGTYKLRVHPALEDASGNRVGKTFEHAPDADQSEVGTDIPFTIR